jgi:hypothetical protein
MTEFSITTQQYEEFNAHYTWMLVKYPTYRYGQAFLNYFREAEEYLIRNSHLGGNPGHMPNNSDILWNEKSYKKAKSMIEDFIEII